MEENLKECLTQKWYTQGFAARPLFMYGVPSLDTMIYPLGYSYTKFLISIKQDYCEFNYLASDFSEHAQLIIEKLKVDKKYLQKQRAHYEKQLKKCESVFLMAEGALSKKSDKEIIALAHELILPLELTAGIAHLIEGVSLRLEHDVRKFLDSESDPKKKNSDFSVLSSPITQSFLSKKDELLWSIKNSKGKRQEELVTKFMEKFFWIQSSYVQNVPLTKENVLLMANELKQYAKPNFVLLKEKKKSLYKKYGLTNEQKFFIQVAEFLIDWQDERKARIYRGIHAVGALCREISRRFSIEEKLVHYLLLDEFSIKGFVSGTLKTTAKERYAGVIILRTIGKKAVFTGSEFNEFNKLFRTEGEDIERINGIAASLGTATGPVRICTTLASADRVQQGDVLVVSMTRPEYISAMKKAIAIVTDEGGITCHAAIVSRELGIPCVVGTKVATKSLKDGWIVEVKANHGQVIVLEK